MTLKQDETFFRLEQAAKDAYLISSMHLYWIVQALMKIALIENSFLIKYILKHFICIIFSVLINSYYNNQRF